MNIRTPSRFAAIVLLALSAFFFAKRSWMMGLAFFVAWAFVEALLLRSRRADENRARRPDEA